MNDKYINVLKRLYNTNKFKQKKADLQMIQKACEVFNHPERDVDFIHVTGTNGKGSVCKKLSSIFTHSGYKTGLFISPHISTFRERIQINDQYIPKEYIAEGLENIYNLCDKNIVDLTFFELITMLCLNYFRDSKVDLAVMEVGLGGNLDATNVIEPLLSIITSIGMDHMDSLGFTQREIAEKKAGIIKQNKPCLLGPDTYPREVFINRAKEMKSELIILNRNDAFLDFEKENNEIVMKAIEIMRRYPKFSKIDQKSIDFGLIQAQPCRKEDVFSTLGRENVQRILGSDLKNIKKIFLDVGHNPNGLEKLLSGIRREHPNSFLRVVCGLSTGKEKDKIFSTLCSFADKIYLISSSHPRLTTYEELLIQLQDFLLNYYYEKNLFSDLTDNSLEGDIKKTICKAIENSIEDQDKHKEEIIVICGSFFIMSEARKSLGYVDEEDPFHLNELNPIKFNV